MTRVQSFQVFFWGILISFLGSLPLGTMNVTATTLAVQKGSSAASQFAWGAMLIEIICVRLALLAIEIVKKSKNIFRIFEWFTTALIMALSISSFIAAIQMRAFGDSPFTLYAIHPFLLGLMISALNPLHIPFWLGWSTILINKNILRPTPWTYNIYVTGIGLGSILGFGVFIYGGAYLVQSLKGHQQIVNCVIGLVLFITALIQLFKLFKNPTRSNVIR